MAEAIFNEESVPGDFNCIRHPAERVGSTLCNPDTNLITEFNEWLAEMEVDDIPCLGKPFTWVRPNGSCKSKLDRVLVSDDWVSKWPDSGTLAGTTDVDIPLREWVAITVIQTLRIMDWWLKDKGFQNLVKLEWGNYHPQGWGGLVLKQKIKFIKQRIRQWSISQGHISTRKVLNLKKELNALEDGLTNRILSQDEVKIKKSLQEQLWNAAYAVESMLRQKDRVRWLKEGDINSNYFHRLINHRRRQNVIQGLFINGVWVHDPSSVKNAALHYFKSRFAEENTSRPTLDGV
ncbi:hypothetical protein GmHk_18G051524 [Glycine max]|nr:hypothetical protein GmHk_18G051524 [Glycine max]